MDGGGQGDAISWPNRNPLLHLPESELLDTHKWRRRQQKYLYLYFALSSCRPIHFASRFLCFSCPTLPDTYIHIVCVPCPAAGAHYEAKELEPELHSILNMTWKNKNTRGPLMYFASFHFSLRFHMQNIVKFYLMPPKNDPCDNIIKWNCG